MTVSTPDVRRRRTKGTAPAKERLRLWLRLLRASRGLETELRERLRVTYGITLPQFDVLAALARRENGVTMTELSRYLMVSNGNVTGIVERLVQDGLVDRRAAPGDRRASVVRLSEKGAAHFCAMAATHETWVDELLSDFGKADVAALIAQLDRLVGKLKAHPRNAGRNGGSGQ